MVDFTLPSQRETLGEQTRRFVREHMIARAS